MNPFWYFVRKMARRRWRGLLLAMGFAFLSAGGLGAGLIGAAPIMSIILNPDEPKSLPALAIEHNATVAAEGGIAVPAWIVTRLPVDPLEGIAWLVAGLVVLTIFGATANFLHQYITQTIATRTVAEIRRDAFASVLALPLRRVIQRGPSEFVARIVRDAAELQRGLIVLFSKSVAQVSKGLAAVAVAFWFEWRLTLIAMIAAPVLGIVIRKIGKRVRRGVRGSLQAQEGLLRVAVESLQGLRTVKTSTAEADSQSRFDDINRMVVKHELRVRAARALAGPIVETLGVIAIAMLALIAAREILTGDLALENFVLTLGALGIAGSAFRPLASLYTEVQAASAPAGRMHDIIDEEPEEPTGTTRPDLAPHDVSIAFEGVRLTYPGADAPALDGVDLAITRGQRVAFVGPNGSGKTTLVSLVPRLLDPDEGAVLVDGTDLRTVNLRSLRTQIGVVAQETVIFRGTVTENLAIGMPDADAAAIEDAARRAHAHEFITKLRGGYDADLAEQGASLSGGQRQRLAIARAILRKPKILILDEATSQIDSDSEQKITSALHEFARGRTTLVVAHRLATVLDADVIVVLDAGRIVDKGTHDELLERCRLYRRLTETQLVGT